ncbi:NADH dehydrogenase [ubiquinone] 1 alpha subcomplex subunit 6-like [Aricia agestis]|uniref:NADH dehydrogenase [ubiquinone] 1 alpha subcomplex subunit 6-like n=1 Tax=Aricia agestis TaxID=91739 RepID=UPI001C201962|nr:NADH dehydrogenase [ubiquinone] 1 alpha subcomplex subunit 6-like [Aricia agestis]
MSGNSLKTTCKVVRPLMSLDHCDARRRVMGLYRAYFRYIPHLLQQFDIPKNECECKCKLREYFYKHADVTDIRVIDMLIIKGYINLKEMTNNWQQKGHVMAHWNPTHVPKPQDFMGKFLEGLD